MKKYMLLFGAFILFATGCGKGDLNNVKEDFIKNIEKRNSYLIKGTMNIISNEDNYSYNITAAKDKIYIGRFSKYYSDHTSNIKK